VIEEILPAGVAAVDTFEDLLDAELFAAEEAVLAGAVEKRRREFTTGRACARAALARLGLPPAPILPGPRGAPIWPAGIVGSITHCAGYRAGAVARSGAIAGLGVDAEPNKPLPAGVLHPIPLAGARARLDGLLASTPAVCWDRLLFSAKESVYKTWFPLTRRRLGFAQAMITIHPLDGSFAARLLVPGLTVAGRQLSDLDGRWLVRHGLVVTAIALPA
jgi:4'-phosphopantetheinyl transferase EntD